jgi:hypothetical protein
MSDHRSTVLIGLSARIRERRAGFDKLMQIGQVRDANSWEH